MIQRMPLGFGPSPGPRQSSDGQPFAGTAVQVLSAVTYAETTEAAIARHLPPPFEVAGTEFAVGVLRLRNIDWLGGRAYNIVDVRFPARVNTRSGVVEGDYYSLLWENKADPIITGREELGYAKIFADIDDLCEPDIPDGHLSSTASWEGYTFFESRVQNLRERTTSRPTRPRFHFKYIPKTGEWGQADAAYPVVTPAEDDSLTVLRAWEGDGVFAFNTATYQELPTMDYIVNALAKIPVFGFKDTEVTLTKGGKNLSDQGPIEVEYGSA